MGTTFSPARSRRPRRPLVVACSRAEVPASALPSRPPAAGEVQRALEEPRVWRAVCLAVRDERMRHAFGVLRAEGTSVVDAVDRLLGPYEDEAGLPYYLSEERVRAVVYRKG